MLVGLQDFQSLARLATGFFTIFSLICALVKGKNTGGTTSQHCCYVNCLQRRTCFIGRSRLSYIQCDDSIYFIILNAEHQQCCQFGQFCAKLINFGIFRRRLDRKFRFGQFLEIWQFICLNIAKCRKSGLQDLSPGYKFFRPNSPTGYKHFVEKRQVMSNKQNSLSVW